MAPKCQDFGEIMQNNSQYAVHGHSRSPFFRYGYLCTYE